MPCEACGFLRLADVSFLGMRQTQGEKKGGGFSGWR